MPELPDIVIYLEALTPRVVGQPLERIRIGNPFIIRTIEPPPAELPGEARDGAAAHGQAHRLRVRRRPVHGRPPDDRGTVSLARSRARRFPARSGWRRSTFPPGRCCLPRRARSGRRRFISSEGAAGLTEFERGGLEVLEADLPPSPSGSRAENHTLKRALTDPQIFSGIGNAYSDEILHAARLSPMKQTRTLTDAEIARLFDATQRTLGSLDRADTRRGRCEDSPRRSLPSAKAWRHTAASASRAPPAAPRSSGSSTPTTSATTARRCQTEGRLLSDRRSLAAPASRTGRRHSRRWNDGRSDR